jgi:hypothetical protein
MVSSIRSENVGAAVYPNINHVPAVDILGDFAGIVPILECFRRRAVVLLVSLLSMFCAFRHAPNSPAREVFIIAYELYV